MGSCGKTCRRACWLNLEAHPAHDESEVSLRICSRDIEVTSFHGYWILAERIGIEPTSILQVCGIDGGFEDREGHQAPFTLRIAECGMRNAERLFRFFDRLDHGVEVRPIAGVEFGVEEFAIGANLKSAPARGNERERLDTLAEFKNFGRQTDGLRRVVSNDAIFDRHFGFHLELLSRNETIGAIRRGQDVAALYERRVTLHQY